MNKKYMIYSVLIMSFLASQPSFAMHGKFFKLARFVGVTTLPALGLYQANKANKYLQEPIDTPLVIEAFPQKEAEVLEEWFTEKKKRVGVPNDEAVSLGLHYGWSSTKGSLVVASQTDLSDLSKALIEKLELEERRSEGMRIINQIKQEIAFDGNYNKYNEKDAEKIKQVFNMIDQGLNDLNKNIESHDKKIAEQTAVLKHELGHLVRQDHKNMVYVLASVPVGVEMASFGATSYFNKLFNRKLPASLKSTFLRSSAAVGAVVPKALFGSVMFALWNRHRETQADKFAYKNAESRLELEEHYNSWQPEADFTKERLKSDPTWFEPRMLFPYMQPAPEMLDYMYDYYGNKCLEKISQQLNDPQISQKKEETLVKIGRAIFNPTHPYPGDRAKHAQEYIDKWDAEHADKSFTKAIERS